MAITASSGVHDTQNTIVFPSVDNNAAQKRQHDYNNYNNYNNHARAHTREQLLDREEAKAHRQATAIALHGDFARAYEDSLGRSMPNIVSREIQGMQAKGISSDLILVVLEYTAGAPRPSWAYARAVILRSYANGINDGEAFLDALGG